MKILIMGADGYLGWPLLQTLMKRGHEVHGMDNEYRRLIVKNVALGQSVTPILPMSQRIDLVRRSGFKVSLSHGDVKRHVDDYIRDLQPDTIVHLAENPSAPYSMRGMNTAKEVIVNNVIGTVATLHAMREHAPNAHLMKLGTMGEYGTPGITIPEGTFPPDSMWVDVSEKGKDCDVGDISGMMFPRKPGSIYHASKVADSVYIEMLCRLWGLRATDIHQGVVYGVTAPQMMEGRDWMTRFDCDEMFGTVINRFVAQTIAEKPMTVYGAGRQKRGFLPLRDSMECFTIAIENPPQQGEYRQWNQLEGVYSIEELAETVKDAAATVGLIGEVARFENPRKEEEDHEYDVISQNLPSHGYIPTTDIKGEVVRMFQDLLPFKERVMETEIAMTPGTRWDGRHRDSQRID